MVNPYETEEFLNQLLGKAVAAKGSDIHIKVGQPPAVRVSGNIVYFKTEPLGPDDTAGVAWSICRGKMTEEQFDDLLEFDTSYAVGGLGRFRVNVYRQRDCYSIVLRIIPVKVPEIDKMGFAHPVRDLANRPHGLVLVVGATGSGKSTTLAAMIHEINKMRPVHIVTIEDPIEFLHSDMRACVSQREVGRDTSNFASALRAAMRQDPDVLLVGEIRDAETMEIAIKAAETGHLVLSTLHTPDVARTVNRLLALADNPVELRDRLGDCMMGIIAQRLLPTAQGGRVCAMEILVVTGTVREAIKRPDLNPSLKELMERGVTPYGMQTFPMAYRNLVKRGKITKELAKQLLST